MAVAMVSSTCPAPKHSGLCREMPPDGTRLKCTRGERWRVCQVIALQTRSIRRNVHVWNWQSAILQSKFKEAKSIHQFMLERVTGEFDVGVQSKFAGDTQSVGADGLLAEGELGADFLQGLSNGNHPEHLQFAI